MKAPPAAAQDGDRQVEIDALPISERKAAALLLDTDRTLLMWGKHERALQVLRVAGQIAPEGITGPPRHPASRRRSDDYRSPRNP
ncbi:hypothetical protein OHA21_09855 [Actinoplanes sp. NBC_00393]|uniref:hypothetical protein n=1 Tax=Actinoplanes sp. NBC_00393 TaxID=2975953 RepID=UPI002E1F7ADB